MENIFVNKNTRLETVKISMAPEIFSTIDRDRSYLKKWLPFIEMTHLVSDTEKFLQSVISQKEKKREVEKDELQTIKNKLNKGKELKYRDEIKVTL